MKGFDKLKEDICQCRMALLILFIYGSITQLIFHTVCPFAILTGFPCPACGLTHAGIALITGRPADAWSYNPAIYLWLPLILAWIILRYILGKPIKILLPFSIAVCLITLLLYLYRIAAGAVC